MSRAQAEISFQLALKISTVGEVLMWHGRQFGANNTKCSFIPVISEQPEASDQ